MRGYGRDDWEYPLERDSPVELSASEPELSTAVRALDRFIEKVRRFYQSGDFEEVVLNAHLIKELFQLCLRDEYGRQGRRTFRPTLRAQIEKNAELLDYWWDAGIVAFQKIKIGPEIAKMALAFSEEMCGYITSYANYRSGVTSHSAPIARGHPFYDAQLDKKITNATRPGYPVTKGGWKINDAELLYLARPSILGCVLEYKGVVLLLAVLLFGSFFVRSLVDISLIASLLRGISVLLFVYVAVRTGISTYSERYAITANDICIEKGLFLKNTAAIPLSRVAKLTKQQSLSGRLSKTGNLVIKTYTGHSLVFKGIYEPEEVSDLIAELRGSQASGQD